jgi:hypothetical protein
MFGADSVGPVSKMWMAKNALALRNTEGSEE